jgi:hypothetical protein
MVYSKDKVYCSREDAGLPKSVKDPVYAGNQIKMGRFECKQLRKEITKRDIAGVYEGVHRGAILVRESFVQISGWLKCK